MAFLAESLQATTWWENPCNESRPCHLAFQVLPAWHEIQQCIKEASAETAINRAES